MKHLSKHGTVLRALVPIFFVAILGVSPSIVRGQDLNTPAMTPQQVANAQAGAPDVWSSLSLTPDQKQRIKVIRDQVKREQQAAGQRVQSAQQNLDDAIYSDNPNEATVLERARELSEARAEALKVRARTELNIRQVLTPEQLSAFREIRRKAAAERAAAAKVKADAARAQRQQRRIDNRAGNKSNQPLPKEGGPGAVPAGQPRERRAARSRP